MSLENKLRVLGLLSVLCFMALLMAVRAEGASGGWYRADLEEGETGGYRWSVSAAGPKAVPLRQMCVQVSITEPPHDDLPVEGENSKECGRLRFPDDSVTSTTSLGPRGSAVHVFAATYRPIVQKVVLLVGNARHVYPASIISDSERMTQAIPPFRYVIAPFRGSTCVRHMKALDRNNKVVFSEAVIGCN